MKRICLYIGFLTSILTSCKKEELTVPLIEEPKLSVEVDNGTEAFELVAGIDGYYMSTYFENDFIDSTNSFGVGTFAGKLHHYDNEEVNKNLEFKIRNFQVGAIGSNDIDQVLQLGSLDYYSVTSALMHEVQFFGEYNGGSLVSVEWDFGDGTTSSLLNPLHYYELNGPSTYRVCLNVTYQNCSDQICSDIALPNSACEWTIDTVMDGNDLYFSANDQKGQGPFLYNWTFENGITATTKEVKFVYGSSSSLIEHARLTVTDVNGCEFNVARKTSIGTINSCFSNFNSNYNGEVPVTNLLGLNEVEIVFKDEGGVEYSTFLGSQPADSYFDISNFGTFLDNEQLTPTNYLDIDFRCTLFNNQGATIAFNSGRGRIAVAHP